MLCIMDLRTDRCGAYGPADSDGDSKQIGGRELLGPGPAGPWRRASRCGALVDLRSQAEMQGWPRGRCCQPLDWSRQAASRDAGPPPLQPRVPALRPSLFPSLSLREAAHNRGKCRRAGNFPCKSIYAVTFRRGSSGSDTCSISYPPMVDFQSIPCRIASSICCGAVGVCPTTFVPRRRLILQGECHTHGGRHDPDIQHLYHPLLI